VISVGIDAHKRLHVAVALDEQGRELGHWRGPNSRTGWKSFVRWIDGQALERRIGLEGAWGNGRGLAQHLVERGEAVVEINPRWTALGRRSARRPDKSDLLDAHAIALWVHREGERLPTIAADDASAVLDVLTSERESALAETVRLRNQLHALLGQLDPEYESVIGNLRTKAAITQLRRYRGGSRVLDQARAASVRRLAVRLALALRQADELGQQIRELAADRFAPLTEITGVNLLTAGTLAGILGPGRRFPTNAALAAYAGAAPIEASSSGRTRHRLNRGGNRRLNAILYRILLTQAHYSPEARAYIQRRVEQGKTRREARRALKRYIVRAIWRAWLRCDLSVADRESRRASSAA
jgi:transposase